MQENATVYISYSYSYTHDDCQEAEEYLNATTEEAEDHETRTRPEDLSREFPFQTHSLLVSSRLAANFSFGKMTSKASCGDLFFLQSSACV